MTTQKLQEAIADYFKTQPVLKAWLFGSFARVEETFKSDVDILFVPDHSGKPFTFFTHGGMLMDLQELLGRNVDLVVEGTLRPYAAESANRDKISYRITTSEHKQVSICYLNIYFVVKYI